MDLLETLTSQLSGANLANLSTQLGTDQGQTQSAVSAALPLLLGALNKQADSNADAVAQVADQQANDSALDDIGGFLSKSDNGAGPALVSQLFGGQRSGAEQGIAQGLRPQCRQRQQPPRKTSPPSSSACSVNSASPAVSTPVASPASSAK